jgi:hypothetical protein
MSQDRSLSTATAALALTSQQDSLLTLWRTLPDELKTQILNNLIPTGETIPPDAKFFNRVLLPLLTSAENHGITQELVTKHFWTENTFKVTRICGDNIYGSNLRSISRVKWPPVAARPLIRHLRVELLDIGSQTIPFLAKLAIICQTFTGLKKLTLVTNGRAINELDALKYNTRRQCVMASALTTAHGVIRFPVPVLEVSYTHYMCRSNYDDCDVADPLLYFLLPKLSVQGVRGCAKVADAW